MTPHKQVIDVNQVNFSFLVKQGGVLTFKDWMHRGITQKPLARKEVLRNITFQVNEGECLGLMGRNGSGKSTLLRLISGIVKPNKGKITVQGSVAPILALGAGLEPELTGYENIRLLCNLQSIFGKQMKEATEVIRDFSELTDADLRMQVKRFSTGMMARLAFSVAIARRPQILAIDEVLAVGDMGFQEKCYARIDEIKAQGTTILFVSHFVGEMQKICDRAILLEHGEIIASGDVELVGNAYQKMFEKNS